MTIIRYDKLVRDRIPEIIEASGKTAIVQTLSDEAYLQKLYEKLHEELAEYDASGAIDELADLQEIILAIAAAKGVSPGDLERIRLEKAASRGAFEKKLLLAEVIEP